MHALQTTWERYVATWKVASAADKRALYESCLHPACVYRDPLGEAKGWDALTSYMLEFDTQIPGGHFVTTSFMAHHQRSLATWQVLNGAGLAIGEGTSYGEYDEHDKLVAMTGFFVTKQNAERA